MSGVVNSSSSISPNVVSQVGFAALETRETALRSTLESASAEPTTMEMLKMQQQVQSWSMLVQIVSTIYKEVSDALKGVVQKSG
jgi:type III secretion protein F